MNGRTLFFPVSRAVLLATGVAAILLVFGSVHVAALAAGILVLGWGLRHEATAKRLAGARTPVPPEELYASELAPLSPNADARDLYLSQVKRSVMNIIYHESSGTTWRYGGFDARFKHPEFLTGMDLESRLLGEDLATNVLTLVGLKRLNNIQQCIETILAENVPGDVLEAGARKGGACIFMKAVLRASESTHHQEERRPQRRVILCDTFALEAPAENSWMFLVMQPLRMLLGILASFPGRAWRRRLFKAMVSLQRSFPPIVDPSNDVVDYVMFTSRNLWSFRSRPAVASTGGSLDHVRSHFARFGLLDDDVVFLQGLFSETLPGAPIERLSLLRVDADTYESTLDALRPLYSKLSSGGFCIVDDYYAFKDCQRAVDEFRLEQGINEPIQRIDGCGIFWRKSECSAGEAC